MKHLKKYNESREETLLQDIRDILLELEDNGFAVEIEDICFLREQPFAIKISRNKSFRYSEVKDVLLRLKDYLTDMSFQMLARYRDENIICKPGENSLIGIRFSDLEKVNLTKAELNYISIVLN